MSIGEYMPDVLARTMVTDHCWLWLGTRSTKGYGQIQRRGRHLQVHRIAYESQFGDIPDGLVIDHTCHDPKVCVGGTCPHRLCVNPEHLDPVTNEANVARQVSATKTHCKRGHPLSGTNLRRNRTGARVCMACARLRMRNSRLNPPTEATAARAWAIEQGFPVAPRGRVGRSVLEAYRATQALARSA